MPAARGNGGNKTYAVGRDTEPRRPGVRIVHDFAEPCRLKPLRPISGPVWRAAAAKPGSFVRTSLRTEHGLFQFHLRFAGMAIAVLKSERRAAAQRLTVRPSD
ncbi:hypothetical protein BSZ22_28870 [Bradyrhizobium canariense]|nr:hypothetical protein BSZ22_28870 [Bradyrhizobium canariense]OSI76214.1 hypothetical protein BSZ23_25410 [Bradyrhizobium canariense]